jgi:2',3'-cyclic-nucleotide 2'-phosphodiesterase (5'-nucleotidase family)
MLNFCRFIPCGGPRGIAHAKAMPANATAEGNDVSMLHEGDAITGTLFHTFSGPKVDAALMNVAGFDTFILGNHEFDNGDSTVAEFSRLLEIPVLSYNCKFVLLATCRLYTSPR